MPTVVDVDVSKVSGQLQTLWAAHLRSTEPVRLERNEREFVAAVMTGEIKLAGVAIDKALQILDNHQGDRLGNELLVKCGAVRGDVIAAAAPKRPKGKNGCKVAAATVSASGYLELDGDGKPIAPAPADVLVGQTIVEIPVEKIHRRPNNRGGQPVTFPDVADLVESLERLPLSNPIQVRTTSEQQDLPEGHYELVKGERRWTAFQALGRDTIQAIVLEGLDARSASLHAGVDNTAARVLNPIQRLLEIRSAVDHDGLTLEEAARSRGIKEKQAEGDLRLLDLPGDLQAAIADGRLAVSVARVMLPYRSIPAVMKRFAKAVKDKEAWLKRDRDGDQLRHNVQRCVQEVTRPLDSREYYAGYQKGQVKCEFTGQALTDELKDKVKAVQVTIGNKPTWVATDVNAWEQMNAEAAREKKAKKAKKTEGKSANPAAERQQDDALQRHVADWLSRFLRLSIARHLVPGDYRTRRVCRWVRLNVKDSYAECNFARCVVELRDVKLDYCDRRDWWDLLLQSNPDTDDPVDGDDVELCLLTQLILWPAAPRELGAGAKKMVHCGSTLASFGELPDRLPELPSDELVKISEYLGKATIGPLYTPWSTRIVDAWKRARVRGTELQMLTQLLEMPNRRQLDVWCKDFGVDVDVSRKLADVRAEILHVHVRSEGAGLKLPAWLQPSMPKPKKGRK